MTLTPEDPRPAFKQVADVIRADIAAGRLAPGAQVPSVRELAERFSVAVMTAQNAVNDLKAEGLVYTSPGRGTFVRSDAAQLVADGTASPGYRDIARRLDELTATLEDVAARVAAVEERVTAESPEPGR